MSKVIEWGDIIKDPALLRLAKRINRHFLYMSEEDIEFIFREFDRTERITQTKLKANP